MPSVLVVLGAVHGGRAQVVTRYLEEKVDEARMWSRMAAWEVQQTACNDASVRELSTSVLLPALRRQLERAALAYADEQARKVEAELLRQEVRGVGGKGASAVGVDGVEREPLVELS